MRFQCKLCCKMFTASNELQIHMNTHPNVVANKHCSTTRRHSRYVRELGGQKPFQCKLCDKVFAQANHLHSHMNAHSKSTRYQCEICHVTFKRKAFLTRHLNSHRHATEDKTKAVDGIQKLFQCKHCTRSFSQHNYLLLHMRSHMNVRHVIKNSSGGTAGWDIQNHTKDCILLTAAQWQTSHVGHLTIPIEDPSLWARFHVCVGIVRKHTGLWMICVLIWKHMKAQTNFSA